MSGGRCVEPDDVNRKYLHDLRAPLITMRGFGDELRESVQRLVRLMVAHRGALPDEYSALAREILDHDIAPCLGYLESSMDRLQQVLDADPGPRERDVG